MLNQISSLIAAAVKKQFKLDITPEIQWADPKFGDFACNIGFKLAADLKQSPATISAQVAEAIKGDDVFSTQATGGYINIRLKPEYWAAKLQLITPGYGHSKAGNGGKVQVEFISANPTGPLTLGNARGGFIGDVLASVLMTQGYDVTREYYFNDAGTQIQKLVDSVRASASGRETDEALQYKGEYIDELAAEFKDSLDDPDIATKLTKAIFKKHIEPAIKKMGINYDVWFNEKDLATSGQFQDAFNRLKREKLVFDKDGAVWLDALELGDDRDRVLIKSSGDVTYLGNDIPYHLNIFEKRGFDRAIKVLGADHVGQVPSLKAVMARLLPDKRLDAVILQWVRLVKDGQEVKMSKRAGTYVTVEELIDQVGPDVARFFFLLRSADAQMEFDLGLAKEQSAKNPLWYVMYSYARAHSILKKAAANDLKPNTKYAIQNTNEIELIKQMTKLPLILQQIAADYEVHRLTFYGQELARLFHEFYESEKIIDLEKPAAQAKLFLVQRYITLLDTYWAVLGIKPSTKM